jgi:hypothetical protein
VIAIYARTFDFGLNISHNFSNLLSGTLSLARFGSIVQNGKFSAGTLSLDKKLKVVDLPTFGNPTRPILNVLEDLPKRTFLAGPSSFFFGGI